MKTLFLDAYLTPCTKLNSKWITGWNIRAKAINLLEENTEANFLTLWLGKAFLGKTPKQKQEKNFNFIKIKTCVVTIKKMKRQPTEWENIFATHLFDKGLVSWMYKEFLQNKTIKDK